MTASWNDLEGVTLAEKFQLQNLLVDSGPCACFRARILGGTPPSGCLWLALADSSGNIPQLESWQITAGLNHPNLIRVFETGTVERGLTSMAYLLTEAPDEDLAGVLRERPLNQVEAREALLSTAKALDYLHSRGLVHGNLQPAAILAAGDQIKLSAESVAPSGESDAGRLSAANDLRALADCIHAMFSQDLTTNLEHLSAIPQPFREIIRGCYGANPGDPWTARRIASRLELPALPAEPAANAAVPEPAPHPPAAPARRRFPRWIFAPAAIAAVLLFVLLSRKPQPAALPPVRPAAPAAVSGLPKPEPAPPPKAAAAEPSRIWRVVSYTYGKAEHAARMVREINRKWPQLRAEQFSPRGNAPPYFVALGGPMTRREALRLQQRAISSGLPRDTFIRNFKQ